MVEHRVERYITFTTDCMNTYINSHLENCLVLSHLLQTSYTCVVHSELEVQN